MTAVYSYSIVGKLSTTLIILNILSLSNRTQCLSGRVSIAMHVHKKLCDIVLRICMLSFTVAAVIDTTAHVYL